MAENYQLKAGEIPAIPSRKNQNCCFDFSRFLIDEQLVAFHQLEFKSGSEILVICAKTKEKLRGANRFSLIVDTEIPEKQND